MRTRIISRVAVFDPVGQRIVLVRNQGETFWYPPGGEWEADREALTAGATREVLEEIGLEVDLIRLLYVRTFDPENETRHLELVWLGRPRQTDLPTGHRDEHGIVAEARWFTREDLKDVRVFPERLRDELWTLASSAERNPFIEE